MAYQLVRILYITLSDNLLAPAEGSNYLTFGITIEKESTACGPTDGYIFAITYKKNISMNNSVSVEVDGVEKLVFGLKFNGSTFTVFSQKFNYFKEKQILQE